MTVSCSFCSRKFDTLQQLGGHQTRHREEMNALCKEYAEHTKMAREKKRQFKMVNLPHNPAFWVMFRKYGIKPNVREFLQLVNKGGECEIPETVIYGETSQMVDVTLKLYKGGECEIPETVIYGETSQMVDVTLKL